MIQYFPQEGDVFSIHPRKKVILTQSAAFSMLLSCAERYQESRSKWLGISQESRLETFGILYGQKENKHIYKIDAAFPMASAQATNNSVLPFIEHARHDEQILTSLHLDWEFIGDFHSHPGTSDDPTHPEPSDADIEGMCISGSDHVYFIVETRRSRTTPSMKTWHWDEQKSYMEVHLGNIRFFMAAYWWDEDKGELFKVKISL